MAPYKSILIRAYGSLVVISIVVLFLNVFGAVLLLQRKFFLKDTGRKLSHLDQQFQTGQIELPIAPESEEKE
jgi:ABC-type bacteriocin/lantibiotic exporter with double-glycine peptidase domain